MHFDLCDEDLSLKLIRHFTSFDEDLHLKLLLNFVPFDSDLHLKRLMNFARFDEDIHLKILQNFAPFVEDLHLKLLQHFASFDLDLHLKLLQHFVINFRNYCVLLLLVPFTKFLYGPPQNSVAIDSDVVAMFHFELLVSPHPPPNKPHLTTRCVHRLLVLFLQLCILKLNSTTFTPQRFCRGIRLMCPYS